MTKLQESLLIANILSKTTGIEGILTAQEDDEYFVFRAKPMPSHTRLIRESKDKPDDNSDN